MTDPATAAWHALRRSAAARGIAPRLVADAATPWWSATFAGHRVTLTLAAPPGAALDAWLAGLPDADLPIPERLVADCTVDRLGGDTAEANVTLSLLIIDDVRP